MLIIVLIVQIYGVEQLMWVVQFVPNLEKYQAPSSVANNF